MFFLKDFNKISVNTRKKILLGAVIFTAFILIYLWILQLKNTIKEISLPKVDLPEKTKKGFIDLNENLKSFREVGGKGLEQLKELNRNLKELQKQLPHLKDQ